MLNQRRKILVLSSKLIPGRLSIAMRKEHDATVLNLLKQRREASMQVDFFEEGTQFRTKRRSIISKI